MSEHMFESGLCLSPSCILTTNIPQLPSLSKASPGCMGHSSKPSQSDNGNSTVTGTRDAEHEQTLAEKRLLRSRLSTLCQPAYHVEPGAAPPCAPAFSALFHAKEQEAPPYIPLETSSSLQKIQEFRQAFHLPRLLSPIPFSVLDSPSLWLALYFALNLSLTLYNKSVLIHFPYPYTVTALHALCGTIGASVFLYLQGPGIGGALMNGVTPKTSWSLFHRITPDLTVGESTVLLLFSILYTINIVVSNASLQLVTVPVSYSNATVSRITLKLLIWLAVSSSCARFYALLHHRVFLDPSE